MNDLKIFETKPGKLFSMQLAQGPAGIDLLSLCFQSISFITKISIYSSNSATQKCTKTKISKDS